MAKRHVGIQFENSNRVYVYRVPDDMTNKLNVGQLVKVPGSSYDPSPRWRPISVLHEDYKEAKGVRYVEILEVKTLPKRKPKKTTDKLHDLPATVANFKPKEYYVPTYWLDEMM